MNEHGHLKNIEQSMIFVVGQRYIPDPLLHLNCEKLLEQYKDLCNIFIHFDNAINSFKLSSELEMWHVDQIISPELFVHNTRVEDCPLQGEVCGKKIVFKWNNNSTRNEWLHIKTSGKSKLYS
jgi:hypothetical protein